MHGPRTVRRGSSSWEPSSVAARVVRAPVARRALEAGSTHGGSLVTRASMTTGARASASTCWRDELRARRSSWGAGLVASIPTGGRVVLGACHGNPPCGPRAWRGDDPRVLAAARRDRALRGRRRRLRRHAGPPDDKVSPHRFWLSGSAYASNEGVRPTRPRPAGSEITHLDTAAPPSARCLSSGLVRGRRVGVAMAGRGTPDPASAITVERSQE